MDLKREFQIPNSAIVVEERYLENDSGVERNVAIKVKEKRYERLIILNMDEFEFITNKIAPQILENK